MLLWSLQARTQKVVLRLPCVGCIQELGLKEVSDVDLLGRHSTRKLCHQRRRSFAMQSSGAHAELVLTG